MIFQSSVFLLYLRILLFNILGTPKSIKRKLNDITDSSTVAQTPKRAKSYLTGNQELFNGLEVYLTLNGYKIFKATYEASSGN